MKLGGRIKGEREARGWTQAELATHAGLPAKNGQQAIQALEDRDSERSKHAPDLAAALGLTLTWALTGQGQKYLNSDVHHIPATVARDSGSQNEPAAFKNLSPMAQKSIERIAQATATADGDLDAVLHYIADMLEGHRKREDGWTAKLSSKQRALDMKLRASVPFLRDDQATAISTLLASMARPDDAQELPVIKESSQKEKPKERSKVK